MQPEVLNQIHSGHLGIEKCRLRARTTIFWNGLHKDIEELVSKCSTCHRHQASQPKEQLLPRDATPSAWHTITTDLFTWQQNTYLLVADPYSRFPVIHQLTGLSSPSVIAHLKDIFEDYGKPEILQSDNGPQHSSSEFRRFAEQ